MWHPDSIYDANGHLEEGVVHAWLDGELAAAAVHEIEAHTAACTTCAARVAEARGLVAGARRVLGALDAQASVVPLPVAKELPASAPMSVSTGVPTSVPVHVHTPHRWTTRRVSLAAAAVLMFAAGSLVVSEQSDRSAAPARTAATVTAGPALEAPVPAPMTAPSSPVTTAGTAVAAPAPASADASGSATESVAPPARLAGQGNRPANKRAVRPVTAVVQADPLPASVAPPPPAPFSQPQPAPVTEPAARNPIAGRIGGVVTRAASAGSMQLDAVVTTATGTNRAEKAAVQSQSVSDDAKLVGCWRVGATDSVLLLDTLPKVSSFIGAPRQREPILWRRVDSTRAVHVRPAARTPADTTERVVRQGALVRVACP